MTKLFGYTLLTVFTVDLLATSGDITMTWTSPILPKLYSNGSENPFGRPITADEDSWISSLINIGAMISPFAYGFVADRFGRKFGLLSVAIPFIISYLTLAFSKQIYLYYFARLLAGLAVGGSYTLLPIYVAEIAEDSNRGMLSATLNVFWTLGDLIPYAVGPYTSITWFNVILTCVPATFFVLFFFIAPESPYYLIEKNRPEEAERVLQKLRAHNPKSVDIEMQEIRTALAKNSDEASFLDLFRTRVYLKGLLISLVLIVAQQFSGVNAVLFYTEEIFQSAGAFGMSPQVSAIVVGVVIFVSSFGTPFVADRLGRRLLLLVSLLGVTVAHATFGVFFFLKTSTNVGTSSISWLSIFSLVFFFIMYNTGLGPLPWTIASELFPTSVKSHAVALVTSTCWIASFLVTKFFHSLNVSIGQGETFWLFGGFCFLAFIFTIFVVPETRGKSFQEIQDILGK